MLIFKQWKKYRPRQPKAITNNFSFFKKRFGWQDGESGVHYCISFNSEDETSNEVAIDEQAALRFVHVILKGITSGKYESEEINKGIAKGMTFSEAALQHDDNRNLQKVINDYLRFNNT